jgi:hypothetical protein
MMKELLQHCNFTTTKPYEDPNVWRGTMSIDNNFFVILKSASYYYFRGLDYIREELQQKSIILSENYLDSSYFQFIEKQKTNGEDLSSACTNWLKNLTTLQSKHFKFLIPINHYDYRGDIDLGIIKVVKLTDDILKQEFVVPDAHPLLTSSKLVENNQTNTFAIITIEASEEKYATERAYQILARFIYAVKLMDPGSYIRVRKHALSQISENILIQEANNLSSSYHNHNIPVRIIPNPGFYKDLGPYWNKLVKFLYSDKLTDLQDVILSALYWYGESDTRFDSRVRLYLHLITGLEWIVLHPYGRSNGKAENFGKICAKLFSGDEKHSGFYKAYYLKRNNIAHQKLVDIYKEDIDSLSINFRSLLLQLIDLTDKYDDLKNLFYKEFRISY